MPHIKFSFNTASQIDVLDVMNDIGVRKATNFSLKYIIKNIQTKYWFVFRYNNKYV